MTFFDNKIEFQYLLRESSYAIISSQQFQIESVKKKIFHETNQASMRPLWADNVLG